jgi:hypothetical protein
MNKKKLKRREEKEKIQKLYKKGKSKKVRAYGRTDTF